MKDKEIRLLSHGLFEKPLMDSKVTSRSVSTKEKILGHLVGPLGLIFVVNTIAALVEKFFTQQTGAMYGTTNADMVVTMGERYEVVITVAKILAVLLGLFNGWLIQHTQSRQGRMRPWYLIFGFVSIVHVPQNHLLLDTDVEIFVSILLMLVASSAIGLLISAIFKSGESAILVVLVLMIGQVVFSGIMFTLTGVAARIAAVVVCRWGMGALGASTDLNSRLAWLKQGFDSPMYDATVANLMHSWQMMGLITVVCLTAAWLVLQISFNRRKA